MSNNEFNFDNLSNFDFNAACRSCLAYNCEFIDLFSKYKIDDTNCHEDIYINEIVTSCTQILIEKDDKLPQLLCKICLKHAIIAYSFRLQTQKSDIELKKYISSQKYLELSVKDNSDLLDVNNILNDDNIDFDLDDSNISIKTPKRKRIVKKLKRVKNLNLQNVKSEFEEKDVDLSHTELELDPDNKFDCSDIKDDDDDSLNVHNNISEFSTSLETDNNDSLNELSLADVKAKNNKTKSVKKKRDYPPLYPDTLASQTCSVCKLNCPNISALIKHRAQSHRPKKYQCLTCGNGLTTPRGLRIHMRLHTGEKPETCVVCGKSFSDPRTLKTHERIHTGQQPFPCMMCEKRFPARLSLELHLRSHTGEKPYQCQHCDKSYVLENSLKIHMRTHTGVKPYTCKICDKAFTNKTSLSVHTLTHSGVKNFQCTVCGKRMARSGELTVHLRTHSGERPFACKICQKTFTNSSALREHMPTHTGEKNYVCTVCGKRMARAMELKIHMRTHTGEKRYRCTQCDQRFTTSSNMRLHLRKHTGEKPYSCVVCSRKFADLHALKNHHRTHTGEKPYSCDICGNTFTQLGSLNTHLNTHRKGEQKSSDKKLDNFSKDNLGTKSNQHYLASLDDSSLSKILSSSGGIDQSNIDLQECVPIAMHSETVTHLDNEHQNFTTSIENDPQLLNIIY